MKTYTLLACVAALGLAFSGTASAQNVRVGVGVNIGAGRDGLSLRIGVGGRDRDRDRDWRSLPPRCEPPVVVVPPCNPPVVVVEPCHAPIQVTVNEIVDYREESYIVGYTKGFDRVWDHSCRRWVLVEVKVPVWGVRRVPVIVTRVITADWCVERACYGYTDRQGCFKRVER